MDIAAAGSQDVGTEDSPVQRRVRELLREVPDFPEPGVVFRDIAPLLADAQALAQAVAALAELVPPGTDRVAGVEARGFLLGTPMALHRGIGFVPVRKAGRLPADVVGEDYALEYGTARIEVHSDALHAGQGVAVVDDVLATGGTAAAACRLVERLGARVTAVVVLAELTGLGGRERLAGRDVRPVVQL